MINAKIKTGYKRLLNHPQKGGWDGEKKEQLRKKRKLGRPSQSMIKVNQRNTCHGAQAGQGNIKRHRKIKYNHLGRLRKTVD